MEKFGDVELPEEEIEFLRELGKQIRNPMENWRIDKTLEEFMDTKELVGVIDDIQWEHEFGYIVEDNSIVGLFLFPGELGGGSPINNNQIFFWKSTEITPTLTNLKNLRVLVLDNNRLKTLPEDIGSLSKLEILRVNENKLKIVPDSIGDLKNLTYLSLFDNKIEKLPESMAKLSNLRTLSVGKNQLTEIPDWAFDLTKLEVFDWRNNDIIEVSKKLEHLVNVEELLLSSNQINIIPDSFGPLSKLTNINLYRNNLSELPPSLLAMNQLKILDVRMNKGQESTNDLPIPKMPNKKTIVPKR